MHITAYDYEEQKPALIRAKLLPCSGVTALEEEEAAWPPSASRGFRDGPSSPFSVAEL